MLHTDANMQETRQAVIESIWDKAGTSSRLCLTPGGLVSAFLTREGEIVIEDPRDSGPRPALERECYAAIRLAEAVHGPKILALLPDMPADAEPCPECDGQGFQEDHDWRLCPACQGLGWQVPGEAGEAPDDEQPAAAPPAPEAADVAPLEPEEIHPHPDYISVKRLAYAIQIGIAALIGAVPILIVWLAGNGAVAFQILFPIYLLLLILGSVLWAKVPNLIQKHHVYRIHPHGIEVHMGIAWRKTVFIPRTRIQHADVVQGPLARQAKLAELVLHTAGSVAAKTHLHGLSHEDAVRLSKVLTLESTQNSHGEPSRKAGDDS